MRPQTIFTIWGGGILLAVVLYLTGPDRFLASCLDALVHIEAAFHNGLLALGMHAYNLVRAGAIAIYVVFLTLGGLSVQRGQRAWPALIIVTAVFLVLVWQPEEADLTPVGPIVGRWLAALVLSVAGAVTMTHRLMSPPAGPAPARSSWPNYPRGPG